MSDEQMHEAPHAPAGQGERAGQPQLPAVNNLLPAEYLRNSRIEWTQESDECIFYLAVTLLLRLEKPSQRPAGLARDATEVTEAFMSFLNFTLAGPLKDSKFLVSRPLSPVDTKSFRRLTLVVSTTSPEGLGAVFYSVDLRRLVPPTNAMVAHLENPVVLPAFHSSGNYLAFDIVFPKDNAVKGHDIRKKIRSAVTKDTAQTMDCYPVLATLLAYLAFEGTSEETSLHAILNNPKSTGFSETLIPAHLIAVGPALLPDGKLSTSACSGLLAFAGRSDEVISFSHKGKDYRFTGRDLITPVVKLPPAPPAPRPPTASRFAPPPPRGVPAYSPEAQYADVVCPRPPCPLCSTAKKKIRGHTEANARLATHRNALGQALVHAQGEILCAYEFGPDYSVADVTVVHLAEPLEELDDEATPEEDEIEEEREAPSPSPSGSKRKEPGTESGDEYTSGPKRTA